MKISMEEFVKIADSSTDEYKHELISVVQKIVTAVCKRTYASGLTMRDYIKEDKTAWTESWEWIMLRQRMIENISSFIELDSLMFDDRNDLIEEIERQYGIR